MLTYLAAVIALAALIAIVFGVRRSGTGEGIDDAATGAALVWGGVLGLVLALVLA